MVMTSGSRPTGHENQSKEQPESQGQGIFVIRRSEQWWVGLEGRTKVGGREEKEGSSD